MLQTSLPKPHTGTGILHGRNASSLINSAIFHTQAPAIQVSHGIHLARAGVEDFLRRSGAPRFICLQQVIQVRFRIRPGEEDITRLLVHHTCCIGVIGIELHRVT